MQHASTKKRTFKWLSIAISLMMIFTMLGSSVSFAVTEETNEPIDSEVQSEQTSKNISNTAEKKKAVKRNTVTQSKKLSKGAEEKVDDVITVDNIKYRILTKEASGGTVVLGANLGYKNPSVPQDIEKFEIPKTIQYNGTTYKVVKIGPHAFIDCAKLKEIQIPDSIEEIGIYAFGRDYALRSVTMAPSVKKVSANAFVLCENLQHVELSDNILSIGESAFYGCKSLSSVTLPSKLKEISEATFSSSGIVSIRIPKTVRKIGEKAFWSAESLSNVTFEEGSVCRGVAAKAFEFSSIRSIKLPESVTTIGTNAFKNCSNLKSLGIEKTGGHIVSVGEDAFASTALREFTISSAMREFYPSALDSCRKLETINVAEEHPNFVAEKGVLYNKKKTELFIYPKAKTESKFEVPNSVKKIHANAFRENDALQQVTLPKGLESIGDNSFSKTRNLEEIYIPASVKYVGMMAFEGCGSLEKITMEEGVKGLCSYAFYNLPGLREIQLPASVNKIQNGLFSNCPSLEKIVLSSKKYVEIASGSFSNISGNAKFTVENSSVKDMLVKNHIAESNITSLGHENPVEKFKDNGILYSVLDQAEGNQPGTVQVGNGSYSTSIPDKGGGTFEIPETVQHDGKKYTVVKIAKHAFFYDGESYPWVKEITLPATIKEIGPYAFNDCSSMTKINFAKNSNLETIGNNAFDGAGLKSIELPESLTTIEKAAFKNNRVMKEITIPENVVYIGEEAFGSMASITDVYLPKKLKTLGKNIGLNSKKLKAFHVAKGNTGFIDQEGVLFDKSRYVLHAYPAGKKDSSYVLPDGVGVIEESAFSDAQFLTEFTAGKTLRNVKESAFSNAAALKTVDFSQGKSKIASRAFMNCRNLENVKLSKEMTQIPAYLFSGCSSLKKVILPEGIQEIQQGAFSNTSSLTDIEVRSVDIEQLPKDLNKEDCKYTVPSKEIKAIFEKAGVKEANILVDETLAPQEQADTFTKNNLTYEITKKAEKNTPGHVRLVETDKDKMGTSLDIPESVTSHGFKYTVTALGQSAVYGNNTVEQITIPKTVTAIGDSGITGNKKLKSLEIPNTVETIGVNGISDNLKMTSLTFEENSRLHTLGNGALSGNPVLFQVTIPKSVQKMGTHVFFWSNNLEKVIFEEGSPIRDIPKGTFFNCFKLQSVDIPEKILTVGDEAFARAGEFSGLDCSHAREIGERAFCDCKKISKVEFGKSLESIGDGAFVNCEGLQQVVFQNGIKSIGKMKSEDPEDPLKGAFSSCKNLHEVVLPESLREIGALTFFDCSQLEKIIMLQKNVDRIGVSAFDHISDKAAFRVDNSRIKEILVKSSQIAASRIEVVHPDPFAKKKTVVNGLKESYLLYNSTKNPKNTIVINGKEERKVELQRQVGKKWKTIKKIAVNSNNGKAVIQYSSDWKKYPKTTWRLYIEESKNYKSYTSPSIKITQIPKVKGIKYSYKVKKSKREIQNKITIAPSGMKYTVTLQKKTSKSWKKVAKFRGKGKKIVVKFPKSWKKQKNSKWRLYIAGTKTTSAFTTKTITIRVRK